jgi:hypothetical protein
MSTNDLTNLYIDDSYLGLLHANATEIPSTGQQVIYDGAGNASALSLGRSGNGAKVTGTLTIDNLSGLDKSLLDMMWPIGSIYFSPNNTVPFSGGFGTWIRTAEGKFISDSAVNPAALYNVYAGAVPHTHAITLVTPSLTGTTMGIGLSTLAHTEWQGDVLTSEIGGIPHYPSSTQVSHNNIPPSFGLYTWQRIS